MEQDFNILVRTDPEKHSGSIVVDEYLAEEAGIDIDSTLHVIMTDDALVITKRPDAPGYEASVKRDSAASISVNFTAEKAIDIADDEIVIEPENIKIVPSGIIRLTLPAKQAAGAVVAVAEAAAAKPAPAKQPADHDRKSIKTGQCRMSGLVAGRMSLAIDSAYFTASGVDGYNIHISESSGYLMIRTAGKHDDGYKPVLRHANNIGFFTTRPYARALGIRIAKGQVVFIGSRDISVSDGQIRIRIPKSLVTEKKPYRGKHHRGASGPMAKIDFVIQEAVVKSKSIKKADNGIQAPLPPIDKMLENIELMMERSEPLVTSETTLDFAHGSIRISAKGMRADSYTELCKRISQLILAGEMIAY